mmetsp:Transcript_10628/g.25426  ORF Transcript_10628/g.25426 Transcript_10628/m.25426 type:complete len:261 (-) Transcript_10628:91-873(-)
MASGGAGGALGGNVHISTHPVLKHKMTLLRSKDTHPTQFRQLLREVTFYLGYEATRDLEVRDVDVTTPVATGKGKHLDTRVALVPVLRAGLGMCDAMQDLLPTAHTHHIGIYREDSSLVPILYYNRLPSEVDCDTAIILEPMIATAGTIHATVRILKDWGATNIKVLSLVAARSGLEKLVAAHPDVTVFVGEVDEKLTEAGYVIPGLGDVGDRLFGTPHEKPDLSVDPVASLGKATPTRMSPEGAPAKKRSASKRSRTSD